MIVELYADEKGLTVTREGKDNVLYTATGRYRALKEGEFESKFDHLPLIKIPFNGLYEEDEAITILKTVIDILYLFESPSYIVNVIKGVEGLFNTMGTEIDKDTIKGMINKVKEGRWEI